MEKKVLDTLLKVRLPITLAVVGLALVFTYIVSKSEGDGVGYAPEQPIKYSHQLHAGKLGIDCQYCHTGVEKSRHAGVPSAEICMNCHTVVKRESPEIQKLVKYYEEGKPIPWKRIHKLADYVYFDHSRHVNKDINCVHCHGDMTQTVTVEQRHSFRMGECLSCHRDAHERMPEIADKIKKGPDQCSACHR